MKIGVEERLRLARPIRPELCVILSYSKITTQAPGMDIPDDLQMRRLGFLNYFPAPA
ncbi:MAG: hypothetical protein R3D66_00760 [Alphaproteobacteria bacterium]